MYPWVTPGIRPAPGLTARVAPRWRRLSVLVDRRGEVRRERLAVDLGEVVLVLVDQHAADHRQTPLLVADEARHVGNGDVLVRQLLRRRDLRIGLERARPADAAGDAGLAPLGDRLGDAVVGVADHLRRVADHAD